MLFLLLCYFIYILPSTVGGVDKICSKVTIILFILENERTQILLQEFLFRESKESTQNVIFSINLFNRLTLTKYTVCPAEDVQE